MAENEEHWRELLEDGGNPFLARLRTVLGKLPSDPRCMFCHGPFGGLGGGILKVFGKGQSRVHPRLCAQCIRNGDKHPGGAHIDLATVFVDMRGSTPTAERIGDREFARLIDRFFQTSSNVLIDHGALLGRLAGDAAIGYFVPGMAGPDYARQALDSAVEILEATGHGDDQGPWIPLGAGVHAGNAFIGLLGEGVESKEMTALGDDVNIGARLADKAAIGEVVVSRQLTERIGMDTTNLEHRSLDLKGKSEPFEVSVVRVG